MTSILSVSQLTPHTDLKFQVLQTEQQCLSSFRLPLLSIKSDALVAAEQHAALLEELNKPEYATFRCQSKSQEGENKAKNRPHGVLPRDRMLIETDGSFYGTVPVPYINGNLMMIKESGYTYIATQSPLAGPLKQYPDERDIQNTVKDFYNSLIELDTAVIAAIVMPMEPKIRKEMVTEEEKGSTYWIVPSGADPQGLDLGNGFYMAGSVEIPLAEEDAAELAKIPQDPNREKQGVVVREITITKDGEHFRTMTQYHYQNWPDKGEPNAEVFAFYERLIDKRLRWEREDGMIAPMAVHCSAGHGRTAILLACRFIRDYVEDKLSGGYDLEDIYVNIPEILLHMNFCRPMLSLPENNNQYNAILRWVQDWVAHSCP